MVSNDVFAASKAAALYQLSDGKEIRFRVKWTVAGFTAPLRPHGPRHFIQLLSVFTSDGSRRRGSYSRPGGRVYEEIRRRVLWPVAWRGCVIWGCNVSLVARRRT
jgi:hypothetical protein